MSWHIKPSHRLKAIIDSHVGPKPCEFPAPGDLKADHPYLKWAMAPDAILSAAVGAALKGMETEIEAHERSILARIEAGERPDDLYFHPGEVHLEVLGHPCRWRDAMVDRVLGSYLGQIVLEAEVSQMAEQR